MIITDLLKHRENVELSSEQGESSARREGAQQRSDSGPPEREEAGQ